MCAIKPPSNTVVQPGSGVNSPTAEAGFLLKLAPNAEIEIDGAVDDVVRIGRAARKIDAAGIGGVRAHDPEQKRAVGGNDRRRAETVVHGRRRPAPMAPGGEARKVGFEIAAAENTIRQSMFVQQQHAAVPQGRLLALLRGEPGIDLGAPLGRKGPKLRREGKFQPVDVDDGNR